MKSLSYFAPGHLSGFFTICDAPDSLRKGSMGAGICLSKGVYTQAYVKEASALQITVYLNGERTSATTSELAARMVVGERKYEIIIQSNVELPVSQGFGMSGAGALSSAMAVANALSLSLTREEIVSIAHQAEVEMCTGLGDVGAQALGGFCITKAPGAPPYGLVERIACDTPEMVLAVVGNPIRTMVIDTLASRVEKPGQKALGALLRKPTIDNFLIQSYKFGIETGLIQNKVANAIIDARKYGLASMSMLGNSVFAVGDTKKMREVLSAYGHVFVCEIGDGAGEASK